MASLSVKELYSTIQQYQKYLESAHEYYLENDQKIDEEEQQELEAIQEWMDKVKAQLAVRIREQKASAPSLQTGAVATPILPKSFTDALAPLKNRTWTLNNDLDACRDQKANTISPRDHEIFKNKIGDLKQDYLNLRAKISALSISIQGQCKKQLGIEENKMLALESKFLAIKCTTPKVNIGALATRKIDDSITSGAKKDDAIEGAQAYSNTSATVGVKKSFIFDTHGLQASIGAALDVKWDTKAIAPITPGLKGIVGFEVLFTADVTVKTMVSRLTDTGTAILGEIYFWRAH